MIFEIEERTVFCTEDGKRFDSEDDAMLHVADIALEKWGEYIKLLDAYYQDVTRDVLSNLFAFDDIYYFVFLNAPKEIVNEFDSFCEDYFGETFLNRAEHVTFKDLAEHPEPVVINYDNDGDWHNLTEDVKGMSNQLNRVKAVFFE
jgi:hypothetical protein